MNGLALWKRHRDYVSSVPGIWLTLDVGRMRFDGEFLQRMAPAMERAFQAMDSLDAINQALVQRGLLPPFTVTSR